jgi:hypothetical protein
VIIVKLLTNKKIKRRAQVRKFILNVNKKIQVFLNFFLRENHDPNLQKILDEINKEI